MTSVVSDNFIWERSPRALDTSTSYRTKLSSESQTYHIGDLVRIAIPPQRNGFLNCANTFLNVSVEGYISGTGLGTSAATRLRMSHIGINSAFNQVNLIGPNGQYIQQQQNYQAMYATNWAMNTSQDNQWGQSLTDGSSPPLVQGYGDKLNTVQCPLVGPTSPAPSATLAYIADFRNPSGRCEYSVSLMGILSGTKHLPVCWFGSDCFVEIQLTNDLRDIYLTAETSATLSNTTIASSDPLDFQFHLDCQFDVASDNSMREIQEHAGYGDGPVSWSDTQTRCSSFSIPIAELNSRVGGVKSMVINGVRPRKLLSVVQAAFTPNSRGNRDAWECCNPYNTFQLRIGSELYPPREQEGFAQMMTGALECYNQLAITAVSNRITGKDTINNTGATRWGSSPRLTPSSDRTFVYEDPNRGAAGVNLANFPGLSDGLDTSELIIQSLGDVTDKVVTDPVAYPQAAVDPYQVFTIKRFGVLYSVSEQGDFTVSY